MYLAVRINSILRRMDYFTGNLYIWSRDMLSCCQCSFKNLEITGGGGESRNGPNMIMRNAMCAKASKMKYYRFVTIYFVKHKCKTQCNTNQLIYFKSLIAYILYNVYGNKLKLYRKKNIKNIYDSNTEIKIMVQRNPIFLANS